MDKTSKCKHAWDMAGGKNRRPLKQMWKRCLEHAMLLSSLCVWMGPQSKKRRKSQTSPNAVSVVPDKRKTVKTVKHTTETMAQVNTPDSFSTTSDSGYYNTTSQGAIINLLSYAWSATCNAKPPRYVSIQHPQQTILYKLNRLETRLNTLDSINDHLSTLSKQC